MSIDQAGLDVGGFDAVELAALDEGSDRRSVLGALVGPGEQNVLTAQGDVRMARLTALVSAPMLLF